MTQHTLVSKLWDFAKGSMGTRVLGCDQIALGRCPSQSARWKFAAACNSSKFNYWVLIESSEGAATCVTAKCCYEEVDLQKYSEFMHGKCSQERSEPCWWWDRSFCFQNVISENDVDFPFRNVIIFFLLFLPAKPEAPPAPAQEKPSLSEEEIERKCKSIIDEFLHINDFKVSQRKTSFKSFRPFCDLSSVGTESLWAPSICRRVDSPSCFLPC